MCCSQLIHSRSVRTEERQRGATEVGLGQRLYKLCLVGVSAMRDEAFFCSPRQPTRRPTTHGLCKTTQCTHGSESTLCRCVGSPAAMMESTTNELLQFKEMFSLIGTRNAPLYFQLVNDGLDLTSHRWPHLTMLQKDNGRYTFDPIYLQAIIPNVMAYGVIVDYIICDVYSFVRQPE